MKILGIDPGLKATGYGVIEAAGAIAGKIKLLEAGTIQPKPSDLLQNKLDKIYCHLSDVIRQYHPDYVVVEKLYAHHQYRTTAGIMGHARGVIFLACAHQHVAVDEHSVKRIRKALIGNGNATKRQTHAAIARLFGIDPDKLTLDASDALALACGFAFMKRL